MNAAVTLLSPWLPPVSNEVHVIVSVANETHPILLLGLQLLDALEQSLLGPVQVVGQTRDGDDVRLEVRGRHLDVDLERKGKTEAVKW